MNNIELVKNLSAIAENTLRSSIEDNSPVAHVWYEESFNFGDSAIWNGQVDLIKKMNFYVRYACSDRDFNEKKMNSAISKNVPILLRGGGNFGDLYDYHKLRLHIINKFQDNPIIQLPQTAKFKRIETLETTREIIQLHKNVTLLARDQMTLELFKGLYQIISPYSL